MTHLIFASCYYVYDTYFSRQLKESQNWHVPKISSNYVILSPVCACKSNIMAMLEHVLHKMTLSSVKCRSTCKVMQVQATKCLVCIWSLEMVKIVLDLSSFRCKVTSQYSSQFCPLYSQLLPCGHLTITDAHYYGQNSDPHL